MTIKSIEKVVKPPEYIVNTFLGQNNSVESGYIVWHDGEWVFQPIHGIFFTQHDLRTVAHFIESLYLHPPG